MKILKGKDTATHIITNTLALKIQVDDLGENVKYQFIDIADEKAEEILIAPIVFEEDPDNSDETNSAQPCFYTNSGSRYFLHEFIRDNLVSY